MEKPSCASIGWFSARLTLGRSIGWLDVDGVEAPSLLSLTATVLKRGVGNATGCGDDRHRS